MDSREIIYNVYGQKDDIHNQKPSPPLYIILFNILMARGGNVDNVF